MSAPIKSFKNSGLSVAVWEGDYKGTPTYSVTIQRGYKADDGYKNTEFLRPQDLLLASRLLEQAFDYISTLRNGSRKTNNNSVGEDF
jgi:hypothetical protein